jgi:uncharacterized protein YggE
MKIMNRKPTFTLIALLFLLTFSAIAQNNTKSVHEEPYIELTGTAEMDVVPDEIYIGIVIREKYDGKTKITIEEQEQKLKTILTSVGIDVKKLYLSNANANMVKIQWQKKDVLTKKEYTLMVTNATEVGKVFQELDKLELRDAIIEKVSHSKIDSLRKEVRIMAIKAAKDKADYLLGAIGQKTGKALIVNETNPVFFMSNQNISNNSYVNYEASTYSSGSKISDYEIQFEKINISSSIYVKFAIE